jgi:hypothetical protein
LAGQKFKNKKGEKMIRFTSYKPSYEFYERTLEALSRIMGEESSSAFISVDDKEAGDVAIDPQSVYSVRELKAGETKFARISFAHAPYFVDVLDNNRTAAELIASAKSGGFGDMERRKP